MHYRTDYLKALRQELSDRYARLLSTLDPICEQPTMIRGHLATRVDGLQVLLAVEDFKAILAEVKKLK